MMIKTIQSIDVGDWDDLVQTTYNRPYNFQQQDGCQSRGTVWITIPEEAEDFENTSVPEVVNGDEMGVSFAAWLERDPKKKLPNQKQPYELSLFWDRNFYPNIQMVANDLHSKGLIPAGEYQIVIDW